MKSQKIVSLNPSKNYEVIGEIAVSTSAEIDAKIAQARAAFPAWASLDIKKRVALLEEVYTQFVARKDEIALLAAREMGMPLSVSSAIDIGPGLGYMRGYLDQTEAWIKQEIIFENEHEIHYLVCEPRGVIGVSIPWNFPFCNFIWGVIQNLIVGNTVVFKHSEECPLTGKLLEEIMLSGNLPAGVFGQVYGDGSSTGDYLMNSSIDGIHFTGSTGVGKHLYQVAAKKFIPAILELGGSAPGIVFDDADIPLALESIYFTRFVNSGQICDGLKRLLVHDTLFDTVIAQLKNILATKKIGVSDDAATDIGPLVAERQLILLEKQVADAVNKGAVIMCGGKRPDGLSGAYYEPTILTNITPDMRVWREEIFGPVVPIISFSSDEQAIILANDTLYGLGAYIYSQNKDRALAIAKKIETGNVSINGVNYCIPSDPFGGYKLSGMGREHGKEGLRGLCLLKVIALKK